MFLAFAVTYVGPNDSEFEKSHSGGKLPSHQESTPGSSHPIPHNSRGRTPVTPLHGSVRSAHQLFAVCSIIFNLQVSPLYRRRIVRVRVREKRNGDKTRAALPERVRAK